MSCDINILRCPLESNILFSLNETQWTVATTLRTLHKYEGDVPNLLYPVSYTQIQQANKADVVRKRNHNLTTRSYCLLHIHIPTHTDASSSILSHIIKLFIRFARSPVIFQQYIRNSMCFNMLFLCANIYSAHCV